MSFGLKIPLVSIVIINWNYAKYVGQAIASVQGQSYRHFECIVVDNASSDGSVEVISEAIAGDPRFRLRRMPENFGHLGAALATLDELRGEFVNFLDADDVLFENFQASHVQVHLATNTSVSFTSSNVVTIDGDDALLCSGIPYIDEMCGQLTKCLPILPAISSRKSRPRRIRFCRTPRSTRLRRSASGAGRHRRRTAAISSHFVREISA